MTAPSVGHGGRLTAPSPGCRGRCHPRCALAACLQRGNVFGGPITLSIYPSIHPPTAGSVSTVGPHSIADRWRCPREAGGGTLPDPPHHQTLPLPKPWPGVPNLPVPTGLSVFQHPVPAGGAVIWEWGRFRGLHWGPFVPPTRQQRQRHARRPPPPPPAPRALERFSLRNLSSSSVPGQQAFKLFC